MRSFNPPQGRPAGRLRPTGALAALLAIVASAWGLRSALDREVVAADPAPTSPVESAADRRQHELLEANLEREGDPLLAVKYRTINLKHFAGALPDLPVLWEPRLAEVGALEGRALTLNGMFGHVGPRALILLHPDLQKNLAELDRALCHEMVHARLHVAGDTTTGHGPAFQAELKRLADEGAFEGLVASPEERARLRAWLDAESARLDDEREAMNQFGREIELERVEVERLLSDLAQRMDAANAAGAGWPDQSEVDAVHARRDEYNGRAAMANDRARRDREAVAHFNREVARYNLMIAYPDGLDEGEPARARSPR